MWIYVDYKWYIKCYIFTLCSETILFLRKSRYAKVRHIRIFKIFEISSEVPTKLVQPSKFNVPKFSSANVSSSSLLSQSLPPMVMMKLD